MYIKSMVLEGFKSYGKRIEINGFDKEFNAITGFNGSGKSNVLDAICFVLGITNLGQVRATTLQDLVYKSGQAGIKKATVTITFDNRDRDLSPLGYEQHQEITITRQVVIGGKNKYMINGLNVPNKRVQDMFCSVQLNVNNPHFLIMQGRITKVLNMKPVEILSMIEEAAGTRMYENKKQEALKTIEKKDSKLKEINDILREEISPKLDKLKDERMHYVEFQRVERELEHCRRLYIAWKYVTALSNSEKAQNDVQDVQNQIDSKNEDIRSGEEEIKNIEEILLEIRKRIDAEEGGRLEVLEHSLQEAEKKQFKLQAEVNGNKESIKAAEKTIKQNKSNTSEDENMLSTKEKEFERVGGLFHQLKEMDQKDAEALKDAQERFQKISSGLLQSKDGENATLEQQLISAKQNAVQAQTEFKQCQMTLNHSKEQLKNKERELLSTESEYKKDSKHLEDKEKELKNLENELKKINYQDGQREELENQKEALRKEIHFLRETLDHFESRCPQIRFEYKDPEPNFNRDRVKGLVCTLLAIKDKKAAYALDIAAGGKLYNVIVDTDSTSKKILQHGQLQQRVTIIPLNRVNGRAMPQQTIDFAQKLVGADNVRPAISLVEFPEETRPAMNWVFGQTFICKDMETAKRVAFHEKIMKKCVTLEGDVFDPAGTLSGGAPSKGGSILLKLEEYKVTQNALKEKEMCLYQLEHNLRNIGKTADVYATLKQKYDLRSHEVNMVKQRLQQTVHHQIKEEVDTLKMNIDELSRRMEAAERSESENLEKAKELQSQLKNSANIRAKQLQEAEKELTILKKKSELSRKEWQKREQESETLELEIKELKKTIENSKEQLAAAEKELILLRNKGTDLEEELQESERKVKDLQVSLKEQKDAINQQNKEIQKLVMKKDDITKQNKEAELDIKRLSHEINTIRNNAKDCLLRVSELERKYEWIEQEKAYFGTTGGRYDFDVHNPEDINKKLRHLESIHKNLSRNVNTRAMNLLDKEEEQYNEMLKKKKIVENDKLKILETIKHLDRKKKETLLKAWEQVSKDFGSIFSSLLPGAEAKLQPPENQTVMDGLEVKVGFSGVWKESLGELSGGQRSLVALSLILAMLLFKPAPLYILDEVDAALDLSHTENIGTMLKRHFKHSQFIVVSLKDGMFNNANVLFTTRFVDGMSTITRTERGKAH